MAQQPQLPEDFGNPWMANLQEIGLPGPVPWTPQTIGWYILAALLVLSALWLGSRLYRRWQANAYRRAALAEIGVLERQVESPDTRAKALQSIPALLKRVALVAYPRAEVAQLSGDAWLRFLDGAVGSTDFATGAGQWLPDLSYDSEVATSLSREDSHAIISLVHRWIRGHRGGFM